MGFLVRLGITSLREQRPEMTATAFLKGVLLIRVMMEVSLGERSHPTEAQSTKCSLRSVKRCGHREEAHGMTTSRHGVVCGNILAVQQWVVTSVHF